MKREKLNLGEKVAVICEGGAETAIMEMLLDAGRLIFTEEDLFFDGFSIHRVTIDRAVERKMIRNE